MAIRASATWDLRRISEMQGDKQKALEIYEEYLATLMKCYRSQVKRA